MSTALVPVPSAQFPPPFPVEPPPVSPDVPLAYDRTTQAVLRYLEAGRKAVTGYAEEKREHADALDHLMAICWKATRPYFLTDPNGSLLVIDTPQFNVFGQPTGYMADEEGASYDTTRDWIQIWLLEFLAPYLDKSDEELVAAASKNEFRYLGRKCRLKLIDAVRKALAQKRERPPHVGFDSPLSEDGGTLAGYVGTERPDAPSSLATGSGFQEFLTSARNAIRVVMDNDDELQKLGLLTGLLAYLGNAEHVLDQYYEGRVTRSIARMLSVSTRSARSYKRKFRETMRREAGHQAVRAVWHELQTISPRPVKFGDESREALANARLFSEAKELLAEYGRECRDQGIPASALAHDPAAIELARDSWQ